MDAIIVFFIEIAVAICVGIDIVKLYRHDKKRGKVYERSGEITRKANLKLR